MHPILSDGRRLSLYATALLPLATATAALLTREPNALPWGPALWIATSMGAVALALLLPVWYLCGALPPETTSWSHLLATHGAGAVLFSAAWTWAGAGPTSFVGSWYSRAGLLALYQAHVPPVAAGGVLLYLLAVSFHYTLLAMDATRRAEQESAELAILARESELRALKAQIHPHFLFNSLNSISALVGTDPARAREMCILLAELFRKSLAIGEKSSVALEDELAITQTYLAIEGLRMGDRLRVETAVDEGTRRCRIPPLLLQPLVENAIRHGVATCAEGGVLRLTARSDDRRLSVRVENPFDPETPARPGVGVGLANVRRRLLTRYGDRAVIEARRLADRFEVTLWMPAEVE